MGKLTKKQKEALSKYDATQAYTLEAAADVLKTISYTKFDASVDIEDRKSVV